MRPSGFAFALMSALLSAPAAHAASAQACDGYANAAVAQQRTATGLGSTGIPTRSRHRPPPRLRDGGARGGTPSEGGVATATYRRCRWEAPRRMGDSDAFP